MIWYLMNNEFTLWFAFIMNFAWGLQDAGVNVYSDCLCGFEFESETLPFSVLYFSQSMFCFIFTYVEAPLTTKKLNIIYMIGCAVVGLIAWFFYYFTFDHVAKSSSQRKEIESLRRDKISQKAGSEHPKSRAGSVQSKGKKSKKSVEAGEKYQEELLP